MKLKITDKKLDELAHLDRNSYGFSHEGVGAYNTGYLFCQKHFRAAEQFHQVTVDKLMEIIQMQNKSFKEIYSDGSYKDIASEISIRAILEADKMLKELND